MKLEPLLGSTVLYRADVSWKYIIGTHRGVMYRGTSPTELACTVQCYLVQGYLACTGVQGYLACAGVSMSPCPPSFSRTPTSSTELPCAGVPLPLKWPLQGYPYRGPFLHRGTSPTQVAATGVPLQGCLPLQGYLAQGYLACSVKYVMIKENVTANQP